jgi:hypothetical protein
MPTSNEVKLIPYVSFFFLRFDTVRKLTEEADKEENNSIKKFCYKYKCLLQYHIRPPTYSDLKFIQLHENYYTTLKQDHSLNIGTYRRKARLNHKRPASL